MYASTGTAALCLTRTLSCTSSQTRHVRRVSRVRVSVLPAAVEATVRLVALFWTFFIVGASSFGGGVTGHLREHLVRRRRWLTEEEFLAALEISQVLPGLNSTNFSVVVGDKLAGTLGAVVATIGVILPGVASILALGFAYAACANQVLALQFLKGASAAAVGLMLATTWQIGQRPLRRQDARVLTLATFLLSAGLGFSLPQVLVCVALPSLLWHRRLAR